MVIYILSFLVILLSSFVFKRKAIIVFSSIILFLLLALRNPFGWVDIDNYYTYFNSYKNLHLVDFFIHFNPFRLDVPYGLEPLYVFSNWIVAKIGFCFEGYLLIHAAFCVISYAFFVNKYSKDPALSYLIFITFGMFAYNFFILRQTLALPFLLLAVGSLLKKRNIRFFIFVAIAGMIHTSAFLFVFVFFIRRVKINLETSYIFMVALVVFVGIQIVVLPSISQFIFISLGKEYNFGTFAYNNLILFMIIIFLFLLYLYNQTQRRITFKNLEGGIQSRHDTKVSFSKYERVFLLIVMLSVFVESVSLFIPILSRAAIGLFWFFTIIAIPNVIKKTKNRFTYRIAFVVLLFAYLIYTGGGIGEYVPFWETI